MKKIFLTIFCAIAALSACDRYEGDVTEPSYIKIDAMTVVDNPGDSWSPESGFFTNEIDAVNVVIWVENDTAETNLGTFQLPCKIPVLRQGLINYVRVTPVVKQDGISGKRIYYPFYEMIKIDSVRLAKDSVTDFGTIQTRYITKSVMKVLWKEFFEPGPGQISIDSSMTVCYSMDTVRSGYGCGVVRVSSSDNYIHFWSDTTFHIEDPTAVLYLEIDYWSDLDFSIGFNNPTSSDGLNVMQSHMRVYGKPYQGWRKLYVNLGALWSDKYNHYPDIRPHFTILNDSGKSGNLFIDNVKLIMM